MHVMNGCINLKSAGKKDYAQKEDSIMTVLTMLCVASYFMQKDKIPS